MNRIRESHAIESWEEKDQNGKSEGDEERMREKLRKNEER